MTSPAISELILNALNSRPCIHSGKTKQCTAYNTINLSVVHSF